ncbi:MAG: hypothetical protein WAS54_08705 [Scrofimicrobium sp.]
MTDQAKRKVTISRGAVRRAAQRSVLESAASEQRVVPPDFVRSPRTEVFVVEYLKRA